MRVCFYLLSYFYFHFISFHFFSIHFISFHFISFHFISFRFVSFRFVSFRFISFQLKTEYWILLDICSLHQMNILREEYGRFLFISRFTKLDFDMKFYYEVRRRYVLQSTLFYFFHAILKNECFVQSVKVSKQSSSILYHSYLKTVATYQKRIIDMRNQI